MVQPHIAQCECWVDLFDADYFMGKMRRLTGPRRLSRWRAKSVIRAQGHLAFVGSQGNAEIDGQIGFPPGDPRFGKIPPRRDDPRCRGGVR